MGKYDVPISQACRIAVIDRKTYRYEPKKRQDDKMLETLLKTYSAQYPTYGFQKLFDLLRMKQYSFNHKRVYRVYCELRLNLKIKPKKRLAPRTANVIDDCNREALGILVSYSLPSSRITRWLDQLAWSRGYPKRIRVDNGPENISRHFQQWAETHGITIQYIQPGKPAQNAYIERFNRSYREAVLDFYLFRSIEEAQHITNTWLTHYNEERPHEALNRKTPRDFSNNLNQIYSSL